MSPSIGEPFILSSYSTRSPKAEENIYSLYASHSSTPGSSDGYVTVAAQGQGVHVLDVASLHPATSYTLGPTTFFSCAPVTASTLRDGSQVLTTYAGIASSSDISEEENGKILWVWRDDGSDALSEKALQKKKAISLSHDIHELHIVDALPDHILVTSSRGDISLLDSSHNVTHSYTTKDNQKTILQSFVFSHPQISFISPPPAISIVQVCSNGVVLIFTVNLVDGIAEINSLDLQVTEKLICASCSSIGYLSVLASSGQWRTFKLDSHTVNSITAPLNLSNMSFPATQTEISLISLGSSFVLFAGVSKTRQITLLLWDAQYSVLFSTYDLSIPTSIPEGSPLKLKLISSKSAHAFLTISPISSKSTIPSSIFAIPYTVPAKSTIALAMGRGHTGDDWIANPPSSNDTSFSASETALLKDIRNAIDIEDINTSFQRWVAERSDGKTLEPIGYTLVKELLNVITQPNSPVYSHEIIQYLFSEKLVSSAMVDGGLLICLRNHDDWKSLELAFGAVSDLPEMDIIECLWHVERYHRLSKISTGSDAMQVDLPSSPSLTHFLRLCVEYPMTSAPLRLALRRYFANAEDVVCLLKVLDNWMVQLRKSEVRLMPSKKSISKNELGVLVASVDENSDTLNPNLPSENKVVFFLQTILDVSFLSLVQYPPSYHTLRKIRSSLGPELDALEQTSTIRGYLEPFVKAQIKALRDTKEQKDKKTTDQTDWMRRRKEVRAQANLAIGAYQVEEIVL